MTRRRVLVLDDEPDIAEVWVYALERAGYEAVALTSGVEALARLRELAPDLILLDMAMPGMDGFGFVARLRARAVSADIPVLIVSALGGGLLRVTDPEAARRLGVVGILPKPVSLETLVERVRRILTPESPPGVPDRRTRRSVFRRL